MTLAHGGDYDSRVVAGAGPREVWRQGANGPASLDRENRRTVEGQSSGRLVGDAGVKWVCNGLPAAVAARFGKQDHVAGKAPR